MKALWLSIKSWLDQPSEGGMILGVFEATHRATGWPLWLIRLYNLIGLVLLPVLSVVFYLMGAWFLPDARKQMKSATSQWTQIFQKVVRLLKLQLS